MKKEKVYELWQDKIAGEISESDLKILEGFLQSKPDVARELSELEQTWQLFDEIKRPEPSAQMDDQFEKMISKHMLSKKSRSFPFSAAISEWFYKSWQVGLASLVLGLFIGWWMLPTQSQKADINQLSSEIQDMKKLMMLTLIEKPKAQERIRAVNMVSEIPNADEKVMEALITTLNHDDNLNVRLAALESLLNYGDQPKVRHALIDALKMQSSAIVLVSIADALVTIQEKASIGAMEELRDTIDNGLVKDKLDESIKSLTSI